MREQPRSTQGAFTSIKTLNTECLLKVFLHQQKQILQPAEPILTEKEQEDLCSCELVCTRRAAPPPQPGTDLWAVWYTQHNHGISLSSINSAQREPDTSQCCTWIQNCKNGAACYYSSEFHAWVKAWFNFGFWHQTFSTLLEVKLQLYSLRFYLLLYSFILSAL